MSNRFWVGGSGNWSDDTNHWATSSGGSPGAGNLPTSSDDVSIDPNSGFGSGGTISMDVDGECLNFNSTTGHTYSFDNAEDMDLNIYGSALFEAGLTFELSTSFLIRWSSNSSETITVNGASLCGNYFQGGGTWTIQDNIITTGWFSLINGTFDANDHNVTANNFYFYADTGYTPTVIMGSGTWEVTTGASNAWVLEENNLEVVTVTPETSTIKISDGGGFTGGNKTYNNLWLQPNAEGATIVYGSNTFNDLKIDAAQSVFFSGGTTQTVSTFTALGTSGNEIYLSWIPDDVAQFNLSKSSGIVSSDYLDISNSNATGGATWYAGSHSVDTTNNDGWLFEDAPNSPSLSPSASFSPSSSVSPSNSPSLSPSTSVSPSVSPSNSPSLSPSSSVSPSESPSLSPSSSQSPSNSPSYSPSASESPSNSPSLSPSSSVSPSNSPSLSPSSSQSPSVSPSESPSLSPSSSVSPSLSPSSSQSPSQSPSNSPSYSPSSSISPSVSPSLSPSSSVSPSASESPSTSPSPSPMRTYYTKEGHFITGYDKETYNATQYSKDTKNKTVYKKTFT